MAPDKQQDDREPVTIYLDQNHWITMACARVSRGKINSDEELAAADSLRDAAAEGRVRLPLSAAHQLETARRGARRDRLDLAETMLDLYHGWHMRSPLDVRLFELIGALSAETVPPLKKDDVFSRRPGTPITVTRYTPYVCDDPDFSPEQQRLVEQMTWQSTWSELMLTDTLTEAERDHSDALVGGWLLTNQELAQYMADNPMDRDMRVVAAGRTFGDLGNEVAQAAVLAGITPEQMSMRIGGATSQQLTEWLETSSSEPSILNVETYVGFLSKLPFVGRIMEITHQRIRNPEERWVRGDLNDIMYLSCAAAYADIVVAEKATAHRLNVGSVNTTPGAKVFKNLREMNKYLEQ